MKQPSIVLSVSLSDGSFDTNITMPIDVTEEQRMNFVKSWLGLMDSALKMCNGEPSAEKDGGK